MYQEQDSSKQIQNLNPKLIQRFTLEVDDQISLRSFTQDRIQEEFLLKWENSEYLKVFQSDLEDNITFELYDNWLLSQYGDYEQISKKRFSVMFEGNNVGSIGFHSFLVINYKKTAEIFYWIDEGHQGRGIITRACQRLQSYAFSLLGLEVLYIYCQVDNIQSENVAKRCGFIFWGSEYEGIDKIEYKRYTLTREQFIKT